MAKGGPSKKTVEKAKAKLVEDKTFGLKNKNKSKNVQIKIKNVKNTVNQVHDKKTKKEMEERERKRMEKLLEKKREEELKSLFKSADAPKDAKGESSAQTEEEEAAQQEEDLFEQIEEELLEEEEMTIEDIIEKERAKIVGGTPVTLESFTKWKEFKMDQAKKEEERRKKAAMETGHGLTGRDLFEFNKNLFVDDEEAADTDAYARDEDVDEDLFLEDDEDDEEGGSASAEKKSEDEFDPDTWKEPKLPKVLLQEYLVAKKVALPKYESVPLPGNQQGHFVKVVLPHLSREYPPKKVYSNKKNAEHAAALIAYRDLTKTFFS